jgi:hypothetical protein
MTTALGVIVVALAGLVMGSGAWPMKLMKQFQFEQWWFIAMLIGLFILPWAITLVFFPNVFSAYADLPPGTLLKANFFATSWGVANVLCGLCFVRIGVALTGAILTGLGVSVGVVTPLLFKGTGLFKNAPDISSPAGLTVVIGVGVMLIGVVFASLAGFGRDRELQKLQKTSGSFLGGLIMTVIAGITSAGMGLSFVYSQGPIVSRVSPVLVGYQIKVGAANDKIAGDYVVGQDGALTLKDGKQIKVAGLSAKTAADAIAASYNLPQTPEKDASVTVDTGNTPATFAVWAISLLGGVAVNLIYPGYLMTKKKTWGLLARNWKELGLSIAMGVQMALAVVLIGKGMLLLGAFGASVGFGIQQAAQMAGGQGLGFISGEWKGVHGKPRSQMYIAIGILLVAAMIMAYGNTIAK